MRKATILFLLAAFLLLYPKAASSQEEKKEQKTEISAELKKTVSPPYAPEGRKDPFRDMLAGKEEEKRAVIAAAGPQVTIENLKLIGIVKLEGKYTAILTGPQEFPLFLKVGQRVTDGFVLSIDDSKVVFRKLKEGGVSLLKPKDIVKEINPEER